MKLKKWLSVGVFLGVLSFGAVVCGTEPNEVLMKMGTRVGTVQCQPEYTGTMIQSEDKQWLVLLMPKSGKIVMVEKDLEGNDVRVIFGKVWLAGKELKLEVKFSLTPEEAMKQFPHPCDFLAPWEA
jgi:hypothetical protein